MAVDALSFLSRDDLVEANVILAKENLALRTMFLDTQSPSIVAAANEYPDLMLLNVSDQNVDQLRKSYVARQQDYDTTPLDPNGNRLRLFRGGMTIWSGFPGSGKTTLLRQLVCHLLRRGRGVFIASLEERPDDMLVRLMQTASGDIDPTEHACQWFLDAYADRLRLWGMVGLAPAKAILGAIRFCARQGTTHAIVDSLTCLDIGASDWDEQRRFATELVALARTENIHIHLVAHPRKPSLPGAVPDLADIAGSSDFSRLVDNVVFIRRSLDESANFSDATPMLAMVRKQRHGTGMCGDIEGWYHRAHAQFSESQWWNGPVRYLPDNAYDRIETDGSLESQ